MDACAAVKREAVVHAASGTNFGGARVEGQGASVGRIMGVQVGKTLLLKMSFRMSGELSLATPQLRLSGKWSAWKPLAVQRVQGCLGVETWAVAG